MAQLLSGTRVYGNTSIDSQLIVGNVTPYQATSNTTGSLIITGGVGITGNVYTGNIVITGITSNGITFVDGTRQTTAAAAGAFLSNSSTLLTVNSLSQIVIANTTTSTSTSTGALVVKGGVGITGNVYSDNLYVTGNLVVGGSSITNSLTTANANISLLFAIDNYQNTIIQSIYSVANTDVTNVSIAATTTSANGLYVPVITIAANGRVTAVSNTLITGGGSSAGYLANSIIFANTTGYLSNTSNLSFTSSTNTFKANGKIVVGNTSTSNSATIQYNAANNTIEFVFN